MYKPETAEYDPYYEHYVSLVPESDIKDVLAAQPDELRSLFAAATEDAGRHSYAEGKWSVKEVLSHLIDGERMFSYRVLRIARGDQTPIEGFEQDGYIENAHANGRSFDDLLTEFEHLRRANVLFVNNLKEDAWIRTGTANKVSISVRALVHIMAGHVRHHMSVLKERYLK